MTLALYDMLGRRVATLVEGPRPAGTHQVAWETMTVAPGVYVVWLVAGRQVATTSLVRMR